MELTFLSIVLLVILLTYLYTVGERVYKSKSKCIFKHHWVGYSPKYLRLDILLTLAKLDLANKEEYVRMRRNFGLMKGGLTSYFLCKRCHCKKTEYESLGW